MLCNKSIFSTFSLITGSLLKEPNEWGFQSTETQYIGRVVELSCRRFSHGFSSSIFLFLSSGFVESSLIYFQRRVSAVIKCNFSSHLPVSQMFDLIEWESWTMNSKRRKNPSFFMFFHLFHFFITLCRNNKQFLSHSNYNYNLQRTKHQKIIFVGFFVEHFSARLKEIKGKRKLFKRLCGSFSKAF